MIKATSDSVKRGDPTRDARSSDRHRGGRCSRRCRDNLGHPRLGAGARRPRAAGEPALAARRRPDGSVIGPVSLEVEVGERLLLVGDPPQPSLVVRAAAGLVRPSAGSVVLPETREGRSPRVAFVGEPIGVPAWMTAREVLAFAARLLPLDGSTRRARVEALLAEHELSEHADRPVRRGGAALVERVALAAALLADPAVLLLDEPLRQVDHERRRHLLRLAGDGRTLIIAASSPAAAAGLVSHVALLRSGRVVGHAAVRELAARAQSSGGSAARPASPPR
jgi:ABC-2 type transport system ATP-binding protein